MTDSERWREFSELLDRALELEPAARADWLRGEEVRAPEHVRRIRALLASLPELEAEAFLAERAPFAAAPASLVGARVGPWAIEAELGRGGMSSVWRARREDGLYQGTVAIKFVNASGLGRAGEERFRREGLLLGRLQHPNIARLLDAGVFGATQQPYLVLEHVDGDAIDAHCDRARLGVRARLELFLQVLEAVAHAHGHLVVHRDLKPSNILVTRDGTAKLLDFGIAKLLEEEGAHTRSQLALTPQYAAPEQVLGAPITTRTDVYALGLVLFRLVTGAHAVTLETTAHAELVRAVAEQDPPAPSSVAPGIPSVRAELPGDLDNIVRKALRKDPAERYGSAAELAEDLRRWLRTEPVSARADTLGYRVSKFVRRNRGAVAGSVLVGFTLVAALAITATQMIEARRQRDAAEHEAKRARAQADMMDQVLLQFAEQGERITPQLLLDRSVAFVERRFAEQPEFAVGLLIHLSGRYMNLGDTERELATLEKAAEIAERAGDARLIARAACNTVETDLSAGHMLAARARLEKGLAAAAQSGSEASPACLLAEAKLLEAEGDRAGAIAAAERAAAILEADDPMRLLDYGSVASELVVLYSTQQDLAAAAAWNAKDRAALEAAGLDRSEGMAFSLMNRSQILGDAGQWLEALATQREVMARFEAHLPEAELHPRVVSWLARCLAEVGAYDAAHARFAQAEARARAAENWAALAPVYVERASVELQRGNLAEAERAIAAGRALIAGDPVANRAGAHSLQVAHASLALARGDLATARGALDELFAELPEPQWRTTRGASRALVVASAVALAGGDVAQARTRAEQALRVASAVAVDEARSADVGDAWLALARAEQRAGRVDALQSAARRAEAALRLGRGPEHPATRAASALLGH